MVCSARQCTSTRVPSTLCLETSRSIHILPVVWSVLRGVTRLVSVKKSRSVGRGLATRSFQSEDYYHNAANVTNVGDRAPAMVDRS